MEDAVTWQWYVKTYIVVQVCVHVAILASVLVDWILRGIAGVARLLLRWLA